MITSKINVFRFQNAIDAKNQNIKKTFVKYSLSKLNTQYVKNLMTFETNTVTHVNKKWRKRNRRKSTTFFFSVKQTSIKLVVLFCSQFFEIHFLFSNVKRNEYLASQNDFQNDFQEKISRFESTSSKLISESTLSKSISESTLLKSILCSFVIVFVVVLAVVFVFVVFFIIIFVDVFIQHFMISFLISSTHLNWQTIMMQMKE